MSILFRTTTCGRSISAGSYQPELGVDRLEIGDRVASLESARGIEHVDEHLGAGDVAQELVAEAGAAGRALDQPGHVGHHEGLAAWPAELDHAEVRLEGREGVVGDLRLGGARTRPAVSSCRRSGSPTRPTSAMIRSSSRTQRSSPGSPSSAMRGAWRVELLKWRCRDRPCRPWRRCTRRRSRSGRPAARRSRRRRRSCRAGHRCRASCHSCRACCGRRPVARFSALKWRLNLNGRRLVRFCLTRKRTSPPWPPSPPSGPPLGTNFSRRKDIAPFPPSPALT